MMKKIILGIGALLLTAGVIGSLLNDRILQASDEVAVSESSQTSVASAPPAETTESAPPLVESVSSEPMLEDSSSSQDVLPAISESSEPISSETQVTKETSVSEETKETTSETISSSSVQESTEESTTSTSKESSTESTTTDTTSTSTTQSQMKESSNSKEGSIPSSSSSEEINNAGNGSEGQEAPDLETTPNSPNVATPPIAEYPAQPSVMVPSATLPTIGNTNPLGNHEVELDESLRVSQVAESDLNGYELPLLSSFGDPNQGVLIYEGLRQLGEKEVNFTTQDLLEGLYGQLFNQSIEETVSKKIAKADLQPGDILVENNQPIGLYLDDEHYLTVQKKTSKEKDEGEKDEEAEAAKTETKQEVVVSLLIERKEKESISGTRPENLTKTAYAEDVKQAYPASLAIDTNDQTQQFIDQIATDAQKLGLKYDVFASVMIAQAILESGSGTSGLSAAPNYNLFGVKGSYNGQSVSLPTQEDRGNGELYTISAAFRRYPSYGESLGDYVSLIRQGISGNDAYYQEVWRSNAKNYLRAAYSLTGKYATDTSYHKKVSSIIAAYRLTSFDQKLTTSDGTSAILQGKENIPAEYREKMKLVDYDGKNYNTSGSYPVGQCTWYAFNRVSQLGGHVDDFMGNGGEWGTKGRTLGYEVTQTPKVGYLVSFSPGTAGSDPRYGHVAFVEAVTENGILISEGNVVGGTTISYRVIPNELAKSNAVSYIKPQ